jgi:hypothetical protein
VSRILTLSAVNAILAKISRIPNVARQADFLGQVAQAIHSHAEIYFIGFLALSPDDEWSVFCGGSVGRYTDWMLSRGFKIELSLDSYYGAWIRRVIYDHQILQVGLEGERMLIYSLLATLPWSLDIAFKGDEGRPFLWGAPLLPETRWELFLPLRSEDGVKGVIWIHSADADSEFELQDIVLFQLLTDQITGRLWPG